VSRRGQIAMSGAEAAAFLAERTTMTCATVGRDGWPHLMPLWYVVRDEELWAWTYAKSQKAVNLRRDPRCTLQVEDGTLYGELRGVMLACRAELRSDVDAVARLGAEIIARHGGEQVTPELERTLRGQAAKRVAVRFRELRRVTWDHRKLEGTY
jgi:PPOX class probable F420-dependent enzyme